jgi:SAM-dependent methyltransferase
MIISFKGERSMNEQLSMLIDPDNAAALAQRITQEDLLREITGGLWPSAIDDRSVKMVLDLGCGPGQWATAVAFAHPEIHVIGVDPSVERVRYARTCAQVQYLSNVTFATMSVEHPPLAFPDGTFDFISGRWLSELLDRKSWPLLLAECLRLLRPGGMLCLTEEEVAISNSLALQHTRWCLYRVLADQQRTYSVDRRSVGICPMLPTLMKQAGFAAVSSSAFHVDSSAHSPLHETCCTNQEVVLALLKPALQRAGVIEEAEYEALCAQIQIDMMDEHFVNVAFGLQAWGTKA